MTFTAKSPEEWATFTDDELVEMNSNNPYAELDNDELFWQLGDITDDMDDDYRAALMQEVGIRLGVDGIEGLRDTNLWAPAAERLRRFMALWGHQDIGKPWDLPAEGDDA